MSNPTLLNPPVLCPMAISAHGQMARSEDRPAPVAADQFLIGVMTTCLARPDPEQALSNTPPSAPQPPGWGQPPTPATPPPHQPQPGWGQAPARPPWPYPPQHRPPVTHTVLLGVIAGVAVIMLLLVGLWLYGSAVLDSRQRACEKSAAELGYGPQYPHLYGSYMERCMDQR